MNAVPRQTVIGHAQRTLSALQHDAAFRTNIGIVNLCADAHSYAVAVQGERASSDVIVSVPPYSLFQTALPEKDYGASTIAITADAPANWVSYGSTIDRITGEAHTNNGG